MLCLRQCQLPMQANRPSGGCVSGREASGLPGRGLDDYQCGVCVL